MSGAEIDLAGRGARLERRADGVWIPLDRQEVALSYPEAGNAACFQIEDDSFWFAHRNRCIAAALSRHPFRGPLLDVGAGNGVVSQALEREGISAVAIEPGPVGAVNAKHRGLANVVCATLEEARFPDAAFEAAGAFDVVEHIEDPERLLQELHRVLRPSAVLCVTVPAYDWLWSTEDELAGHHRRYTVARLRRELDRAGFEVAEATYLFAPLVLPLFLLRSVPHRLLRRPAPAVERAAEAQHTPSRFARSVLDALLAPEVERVRNGKSVPAGTTCLAIAKRR